MSRAPGRALSRPASGEAIVGAGAARRRRVLRVARRAPSFGRVGLPGPGFFPFALGIALGLLALAILFHRLAGARAMARPSSSATATCWSRSPALAGVAFAFERADAYVALGAFAAVLLLLVARAALWRVVLGAVLGMVAVWLFFGVALGVRLPTGEFWQELADRLHRAALLQPA